MLIVHPRQQDIIFEKFEFKKYFISYGKEERPGRSKLATRKYTDNPGLSRHFYLLRIVGCSDIPYPILELNPRIITNKLIISHCLPSHVASNLCLFALLWSVLSYPPMSHVCTIVQHSGYSPHPNITEY